MKAPSKKPEVKLVGGDGNIFSIIGKARIALRKAGADQEFLTKFTEETTSVNSYNKALQVVMKYVEPY